MLTNQKILLLLMIASIPLQTQTNLQYKSKLINPIKLRNISWPILYHYTSRHQFIPLDPQLVNQPRPYTFLFSFPRSGNTWLRYCIEFLTKRPTAYFAKNKPSLLLDHPLGNTFHLGTDLNKKVVWKIHASNELFKHANKEEDRVIVIVRNFKEVLTRHLKKPLTKQTLTSKKGRHYFDNLVAYDQWPADKRLLVHYEDLIMYPEQTLRSMLAFLQEDDTYMAEFLKDYNMHKERVVKFYGKFASSESKGNDILFHSKKIDPGERALIDKRVAELYPDIWDKYLKDLYSEEVLLAQGVYEHSFPED